MRQKSFFLFCFFFLQFSFLKAAVFINELMPKNLSSVINEDFNFEGWAELYNSGTQSVDISNYYFSDDLGNLLKWQIKTDGLLEPGQFVVIYFDELDKENHASFKLKTENGVLYLSDKQENRIDRLSYIISKRNISYGRMTDGGSKLVFFFNATPGKSNNGEASTLEQASIPVFSLPAGFYTTTQQVTIQSATAGAKIYYTTDGSEPQPDVSKLYTAPIPVSKTMPLRAIAVVEGALPSEIETASYFINPGNIKLPVISLVTDSVMLYSKEIGMLVAGINGSAVPGYCSGPDSKANYWNDWDRPCNFELFDEARQRQLNQEVKISNYGNCSRTKYVKSIKINATKAHGGEDGNKLNYAIFKEKPNLKWKSIVLRNSGNDFGHSFLRDAFMQTIISGQMDIDHQAYQPSVVFVNGKYYGMLNIRERTNKDFVYSNYGLDEQEFDLVESAWGGGSTDYEELIGLSYHSDMNTSYVYDRIKSQIDIDEFLNYFIAEIYYANTDWPGGNTKAWKRKVNGKWRWILYDTDFGFSLYGSNYSTNTLTKAAEHPLFAGFLKNDKIKEQFVTKFIINLATTFDTDRVITLLNEMANYIKSDALSYESYLNKDKWRMEVGSWTDDIETMRTFARQRPENIYKHLKSYFNLGSITPLHIHSDIENVSYVLNGERIGVADFSGFYFNGSDLHLTPVAPDGYRFKHWEIRKENPWISFDATWNYYDKGEVTSAQWKGLNYDDSEWESGQAPLGYGISSLIKTTVKYGGSMANRNITTYFRKEINVEDLSKVGKLYFTLQLNDGAVVYLNGTEIHRENLPEGVIEYSTKTTENLYSLYRESVFELAPDLLQQGKNVLAVEVHQASATSTSLAFALEMEEENSKILLSTDARLTYEEVFSGGDYKAVFEQDPEWQDPMLPKLYLSEICISNSQYVDEFFESDDWIEIYNNASSPVNIAGMYVSDSKSNLRKYQIPDNASPKTTVPAKGYLILWADGQPEQGPLHTNFSLSATRAQTVSMSQVIDGELYVIDSVSYKLHGKGETFARFSYDFEGEWKVTSRPTFAVANTYAVPTDIPSVFSDRDIAVIYPNPVSETLWFSLSRSTEATVTILNLTGNQVLQRRISDGEGVDVSRLSSGLYLAVINNPEGKQVVKFIKK